MKNQELIKFLNQLLSNYFICEITSVPLVCSRKSFFQLHSIFEKMYVECSEHLDEIAEHIMVIGGKQLATLSMYLKQGTLDEANADDTVEEIILQLSNDLERLINEVSELGLSLTNEVTESLSNNILTEHLTKIENKLWMLKAYQSEN